MNARETKTPEQLAIELLTTCQSMTHGTPDAERLLSQLRRDWAAEDRAKVLTEAADAAHAEGDRLYDDVGLKAAEAAWGVATKLRAMADDAAPGGA